VSTLLLSKSDIAELLNMREVMDVVEQAFRDYASGQAQMPTKVYIELEKGDFRAMPSAVPGAVGVKWVNVHPANRELGLPTVMGILIYNDPDSAYPLAIMDATEITAYRTAATSANASRYLARSDSRILGLIGAGRQAYMHLQSHALVFPIEVVRVCDLRPEAVEAFIGHFPAFNVEAAPAEKTAASDIVCTLTPARAPVVKASWISPGTHINAVGADAEGKQELESEILRMARVVVDDIRQACQAGEINVALRQGLFKEDQIWGTLGEIIAGTKPGRQDAHAITVFDSTGLAIEDLATARLVYQKAKQRGGYRAMDLV
jgi:alanine dehydrogenase